MEKGKQLQSTCQSPIGKKEEIPRATSHVRPLNVMLRHTPNSLTPIDHTVTYEASNPARVKLFTNLIRIHHAILSFR